MKTSRRLTADEFEIIDRMLAGGFSQAAAARAVNCSTGTISEYLRRKRGDPRRNKYDRRGSLTEIGEVHDVRPPHDVLAERERRLALAPRDTTALLMGDPPPGYSAAERR